MSEKSHVTLEQQACVVCGSTFETGAILMDRRLRPHFEKHTMTGWGLCPRDQALFDQGYLALVGIDLEKSAVSDQQSVKPEDAYRLGRVLHIKRHAAEALFNVPLSASLPAAFVASDVLDRLEPKQGTSPSNDQDAQDTEGQ